MIRQTIHIKVTAADIRDGEPGRAHRCAVALALAQSVPGFMFNAGGRVVELPEAARKAIEAFDGYEQFDPFEFDVKVSA